MSVIGSNILAGASGQGGAYNLERSLRFRSSASAYLNRTPATTTNQKTFTWSSWNKLGALGTYRSFFSSATTNPPFVDFSFQNNDVIQLDIRLASGTYQPKTTAVFRDPSAWYHIVVAIDTTQATEANRVKLYVNGVQQTLSTVGVPQNSDLPVNTTVVHNIGRRAVASDSYLDGYLTEVNFIDGQALTPSSFGSTNASTGVWQPKKYAGTYGTNGFYLPFTDNSALTSGSNAGLGKDFSGNGNYWTTNNISITSGSTYDSMTDVPTLTSATASNFCVLNPLDKNSSLTVNNGNLGMTSASSNVGVRGSMGVTTGKWYFEGTVISAPSGATDNIFGVANSTWALDYVGNGTTGIGYGGSGTIYGTGGGGGKATFGNGDVIGVAFDADAQTITFYKNNVSQGSYSLPSISPYFAAVSVQNSTVSFNAGQQPFAYTPPTGFVALNTFNLPTPTIGATASSQANKYFDATLWSGNASSGRAITNSGGFAPALVWVKQRNGVEWNILNDAVRGVPKNIYTNSTAAEDTASYVTALNSNGFTVSADAGVNGAGGTYVGWQWAGNGTGVTNTAGSITSTVSANTSSGFSVVTYTGTGSNATVGHGLGATPAMIIVMKRTGSYNFPVWHKTFSVNEYIYINTTGAKATQSGVWNQLPNSTTFGISSDVIMGAATTYVAYCFSEVAGYSKFGSYTGNGSSDGNFIFTGFKPRFIMIKQTSSSNDWCIFDTARNTFNSATNVLYPNLSNAEGAFSAGQGIDVLSNGFKLRYGTPSIINTTGATYIYAAFAEVPTKFSLAQ